MSGWNGARWAIVTALVAAAVLSAASAAHGYEVRVSIQGAGQVTETTSANLVGGDCESPPNTPSNMIVKTCTAGTPSGGYGWGWDVDYLATPAPGYTFVRWQSDGSSRTAVLCDRSTPPATSATYAGTACKFRTFENLQTRAVFQDTTAPAAPSVGASPAGAVNGPVSFSLSPPNDPTMGRLECVLAGPSGSTSVPCAAPSVSLNPSQSGAYTLSVTAIDASDNRSATVQRAFTVDKAPPQTTLDPSFGPSQNSVLSSKSATFRFTSSEPGSLRCTLDGVEQSCSTGQVSFAGLGEGEHVFRAWAVDRVGNADLTPAERRWTVDTIAPNVTLDPSVGPGEGATVRSTDALFRFTSTEPEAAIQCALDGVKLASCESPLVLSGLKDGQHALRVWAVDAAGNADASPSERRWTVDAVVDPSPADPGQPGEECAKAERMLAAAQSKLRKLRREDASPAKLRKAKQRVRKLRRGMRDACAPTS